MEIVDNKIVDGFKSYLSTKKRFIQHYQRKNLKDYTKQKLQKLIGHYNNLKVYNKIKEIVSKE